MPMSTRHLCVIHTDTFQELLSPRVAPAAATVTKIHFALPSCAPCLHYHAPSASTRRFCKAPSGQYRRDNRAPHGGTGSSNLGSLSKLAPTVYSGSGSGLQNVSFAGWALITLFLSANKHRV